MNELIPFLKRKFLKSFGWKDSSSGFKNFMFCVVMLFICFILLCLIS